MSFFIVLSFLYIFDFVSVLLYLIYVIIIEYRIKKVRRIIVMYRMNKWRRGPKRDLSHSFMLGSKATSIKMYYLKLLVTFIFIIHFDKTINSNNITKHIGSFFSYPEIWHG